MLGQTYPGMPKRPSAFTLILFIIFGLYFLNYPFQFVKIPVAIAGLDKWLIFAGGIMLIIGGVNHFTKMSRGY